MTTALAVKAYEEALAFLHARAKELLEEMKKSAVAGVSVVADFVAPLEEQLVAELETEEAKATAADLIKRVATAAVEELMQPDPDTGLWAG